MLARYLRQQPIRYALDPQVARAIAHFMQIQTRAHGLPGLVHSALTAPAHATEGPNLAHYLEQYPHLDNPLLTSLQATLQGVPHAPSAAFDYLQQLGVSGARRGSRESPTDRIHALIQHLVGSLDPALQGAPEGQPILRGFSDEGLAHPAARKRILAGLANRLMKGNRFFQGEHGVGPDFYLKMLPHYLKSGGLPHEHAQGLLDAALGGDPMALVGLYDAAHKLKTLGQDTVEGRPMFGGQQDFSFHRAQGYMPASAAAHILREHAIPSLLTQTAGA